MTTVDYLADKWVEMERLLVDYWADSLDVEMVEQWVDDWVAEKAAMLVFHAVVQKVADWVVESVGLLDHRGAVWLADMMGVYLVEHSDALMVVMTVDQLDVLLVA